MERNGYLFLRFLRNNPLEYFASNFLRFSFGFFSCSKHELMRNSQENNRRIPRKNTLRNTQWAQSKSKWWCIYEQRTCRKCCLECGFAWIHTLFLDNSITVHTKRRIVFIFMAFFSLPFHACFAPTARSRKCNAIKSYEK